MTDDLDTLRPEVREAWRRMRYASELTKGTVMSSTADMELIFRDHLWLARENKELRDADIFNLDQQLVEYKQRAERAEAELASAARMHQQLLDTIGANDQADAMRIIAQHHARELAKSEPPK